MAMEHSATRMIVLQMGSGLMNFEPLLTELEQLESQLLGAERKIRVASWLPC